MGHGQRTHLRRRSVLVLLAGLLVASLPVAPPVGARVPRSVHRTLIPSTTVSGRIGLFREGRFQGFVARVSGCSVGAVVIGPDSWTTTDLLLGRVTSTPCVLDHGVLAKSFMTWLVASLAGDAPAATFELVSYAPSTGAPVSAIELAGATLTNLALPGLDAASGDVVTLRSTIVADSITPVRVADLPAPSSVRAVQLHADDFKVAVGGVLQGFTRSVGSLTDDALFGDGITDPRSAEAGQAVFHPGALTVTVATKGVPFFDAWLADLVGGAAEPEREVVITYLAPDLTKPLLVVSMGGVGISGADAGLDPTRRTYAFYVQDLVLSVP